MIHHLEGDPQRYTGLEGRLKVGEPTGETACEACGRSHLNIDEILHKKNCPQCWTKTDYWRDRFLEG